MLLPSACSGVHGQFHTISAAENPRNGNTRFEPQVKVCMGVTQSQVSFGYFGLKIIQKPTHLARIICEAFFIEAWSNQILKPIYRSNKSTKAQRSATSASKEVVSDCIFQGKEWRASQDRAIQPKKNVPENLGTQILMVYHHVSTKKNGEHTSFSDTRMKWSSGAVQVELLVPWYPWKSCSLRLPLLLHQFQRTTCKKYK